jgi:predicted transcriptional regulator
MVQVETTNHYLTRLYDEKLVDVGRNKRSSRVVSLTPKGLRVARKGV